MHKKLVVSIFLLLLTLFLFSQQGYLYMYNYQISIENIDNDNHAVIQAKDGILFFANKKGIISYNGIKWSIIQTPSTPNCFAIDTNGAGKIVIGCNNNFGYLSKDNKGVYQYISLSQLLKNIGNITNVLIHSDIAYFYSTSGIYKVSLQNNQILGKINASIKNPFSGIFSFQDFVYVNVSQKGLHLIKNNVLFAISNTQFLANKTILTNSSFDSRSIIIGTNDNTLYLFNGKAFSKYKYNLEEYIKGNILSTSLSFSESELVLATISGGCVIIDKKTGNKKFIINYQTGLPDDEVLALCKDEQGGLWICNKYGISRADVDLPIENYSPYPGLEGNITSVCTLNDILFVGTTEGLFKLDRVNDIQEVQDLIKKEHKQNLSSKKFRSIKSITKLIKVSFKNPNQASEQITKKIPITIEVPFDSISTSIQEVFTDKQIRKTYAIQSIPFVFKQIKGITGKCHQLVIFNNTLLVASNNGLYQVDTSITTTIIPNQYINSIENSHLILDAFYIGLNDGIVLLKHTGKGWETLYKKVDLHTGVFSIHEEKNYLWMGSENQVFRLSIDKKGRLSNFKNYPIETNFSEKVITCETAEGIIFFSSTGVFSYNSQTDKLEKKPEFQKYQSPNENIITNQPDYSWIFKNNEWNDIHVKSLKNKKLEINQIYLRLFRNTKDIFISSNSDIWIVAENSLYKINSDKVNISANKFKVFTSEISDKNNTLLPIQNIELKYYNNAVKINLASIFYLNEGSTQFQYKINGLNNNWSEWKNEKVLDFPYFPSGKFTIVIRAKNIFGQISNEESFEIKVGTPFWKSWWFILSMFLLLAVSIFLFFRIRIKQLEQAKRILEQKILEATSEIRKQKDEIEIQRDDIKKKNEDITSSINYAQRIQEAILPVKDHMKNAFLDYFVLYRPRDIVSGDFFWFMDEEKYAIIIAADCTGHGVPGAFMSMIGNTMLNDVIRARKYTDPGQILDHLDQEIVISLKQDKEDSKTKDGMDITICTYYKDTNTLAFAGANNPLIYIQNGKLDAIRGNPYGLGGLHPLFKKKEFTTHTIKIESDICCYIFSDGFVDQNGGPENKKYMSGKLKDTLFNIHQNDFTTQKQMLDNILDDWMGKKYKQRDDIMLLGFKIGPK